MKVVRKAVVAAGAIGTAVLLAVVALAQTAPKVGNVDQRTAGMFERALIPIGAVIPFFGDPLSLQELGGSWQLCDGSPLVESADPRLKAALGGQTPNLSGRFLRGITPNESVGAKGGQEFESVEFTTSRAGVHTHKVDDHQHSLPARTGPVSNAGDPIGYGQTYLTLDNAGSDGIWDREQHLMVDGGGGAKEGQHRHDLGGETGSVSLNMSKAEEHEHSGRVAIRIVPPYVAAQYIMRIR